MPTILSSQPSITPGLAHRLCDGMSLLEYWCHEWMTIFIHLAGGLPYHAVLIFNGRTKHSFDFQPRAWDNFLLTLPKQSSFGGLLGKSRNKTFMRHNRASYLVTQSTSQPRGLGWIARALPKVTHILSRRPVSPQLVLPMPSANCFHRRYGYSCRSRSTLRLAWDMQRLHVWVLTIKDGKTKSIHT